MSAYQGGFRFPSEAVPHTQFSAKHALIMATVNGAVKSGLTSLRILEVGSWLGASTLLWAESILRFGGEAMARRSSILAVDSWSPVLSQDDLSIEQYRIFVDASKNDAAYNTFVHNATLGTKSFGVPIQWERGQSRDVIPRLGDQTFDIIYIDAGHYYDEVATDIALTKGLLRIGGTMCGDDLNLSQDQVDQDTLMASTARDFIVDPKTGSHYHPGVTLAVGEAFPTVAAVSGGFWSVCKTSDDVFVPNKPRFDGIFLPSFLSNEDAKLFIQALEQVVRINQRT